MAAPPDTKRGATYEDQLRLARCAEDGGFEGFFRADHYLSFTDAGGDPGLPGPTDSWLTLAALARETDRIRLGTLEPRVASPSRKPVNHGKTLVVKAPAGDPLVGRCHVLASDRP